MLAGICCYCLGATLESNTEGEALPAAESSTREPAGTMTSERERGKKEDMVSAQAEEEETVKDEEGHTEKEEKIKDQTEKTKGHDELKGEEDNAENQEKMDAEQETAEEQEKDEETGAPAVETGRVYFGCHLQKD